MAIPGEITRNEDEPRKVTNIEFSSQDGYTMWREEGDGWVGNWENTTVPVSNTKAYLKLKAQLERERGIGEPNPEE